LADRFPLPSQRLPAARGRIPETLAGRLSTDASIEVEETAAAYRSIAKRLWNEGVDGIMLFNFFTWREGGKEPPFELLHELGDPAKIRSGDS